MIVVSAEDVRHLLAMLQVPRSLREVLRSIAHDGGAISDENADALRDLCNDRLDVVGYDESYSLSEAGRVLEYLVDTLYVP